METLLSPLKRVALSPRELLVLSVLGLYQLLAIKFSNQWGVDLGIPCLITQVTGWCCPGCGLSRAGLLFFSGDWVGAFKQNMMIFPMAILGGASLLINCLYASDIKLFKKN